VNALGQRFYDEGETSPTCGPNARPGRAVLAQPRRQIAFRSMTHRNALFLAPCGGRCTRRRRVEWPGGSVARRLDLQESHRAGRAGAIRSPGASSITAHTAAGGGWDLGLRSEPPRRARSALASIRPNELGRAPLDTPPSAPSGDGRHHLHLRGRASTPESACSISREAVPGLFASRRRGRALLPHYPSATADPHPCSDAGRTPWRRACGRDLIRWANLSHPFGGIAWAVRSRPPRAAS